MFHCAPEGVDLLVVSPNESSALTPVISEVYRSGIPVILFDRKIQTDDYTAFIGANNYRLARQLARYMAEHIGYSGNVVIIRGLRGSTADTERYEGFMDGIDGLSVPGGGLDYIGQGKIDASFIYPTGGDKIMDVAWNISTTA